MIGIKKQTNWYLDKAKQINKIRRELNPYYDLVCRIKHSYWVYFI